MTVKLVTGVVGAGKGLYCDYEMQKYYREGRRVVTNYPVDTYLLDANSDQPVIVLPSHPSAEHLNALGRGCPDEEKERFGAIFLDEIGTWLNSRTFADKGRLALINWFLHSRHLGWDVFLMVQEETMLDKQVLNALGEIIVFCRRSGRTQSIWIKLIKKLVLGKKYETTRSSQTKQTGLFRHRVIVETYHQRKSKRDKPFEKFSLFGDWFYGIHDTNHVFTDDILKRVLPDGTVKTTDMRASYYLLSGKTIGQWYYANQETVKTPLISKQRLALITFFGLGTIFSWHFLINHHQDENTITTQTDSTQAITHQRTNLANGTAANELNSATASGALLPENSVQTPTLPPPLSSQWRLTGYLKSSTGLPRYVIRDNAGNVRYIASDIPWEGAYSEIEVDGELVTFWTGNNRAGGKHNTDGNPSLMTPADVLSALSKS